ncbi:hypothetical protein RRG08_066105 [Elysia crispata]|uniref:Uncharacterized protein n=1 Tax=Elysia crispata TaxID=231223 RepID=A0AAE1DG15_9GAST|nr:hypothetical protein RRG08_066105 [Elysia crispata]
MSIGETQPPGDLSVNLRGETQPPGDLSVNLIVCHVTRRDATSRRDAHLLVRPVCIHHSMPDMKISIFFESHLSISHNLLNHIYQIISEVVMSIDVTQPPGDLSVNLIVCHVTRRDATSR